ncbi:MAG: NUDIX hydrolase [Candidatus Cloacimonetes bacterium]|jgi:ADP-ribose pyrophosphatase|nr:NUDIX hydrolase [Candidatus Cloacimonadota bacterium]
MPEGMKKKTDDMLYSEETLQLPNTLKHCGYVYEDPFKKIEKIQADFGGFKKEYYVSDFGPKAALVVIHDGKVLLTRQYRLFLNGLSMEIPAGKVNENESPEVACLRECYEETGVKCGNPKALLNYNPDLEYTRNYTQIYYTDEVLELPRDSKTHLWLSLDTCYEYIFEEKISDSLSLIALLGFCKKFGNTLK